MNELSLRTSREKTWRVRRKITLERGYKCLQKNGSFNKRAISIRKSRRYNAQIGKELVVFTRIGKSAFL